MSAEDAKPAAPAHSPLWDAAFSALRELQTTDTTNASLPARLDRLAAFRYSPETAAKLEKTFGTDRPLTVVRMAPVKNQAAYRLAVAPLHYIGADGSSVDWSELGVQMLTDKAGRRLAVNGSWPSIDAQDNATHFALRNLALAGKQYRGFAGLWFGAARLDIERASIESRSGAMPGVAFEGIYFESAMAERPKTVDVRYGGGVKAVTVAGERVDDVHWAIRIDNIDKHALAALKAASEKNKATLAKLTPEQQGAALQPMLKDFAKAMSTRGAAIEIDDISAGYQGSRASLKGRISVEGATSADFDAIPALLKKIVARFEVKVPLAMVRAISGTVAQKQLSAQHPGTPADPQAAAQMGQTMTDVVVGKLINAGYARIDNDVLVSTVEWRNGTLRANGKEVSLPKPPQAANAAAAGNGQLLQARRIADTCKLPDYPEDVVRQDLPLQLTLRFVVGADGHLRDLALARASQSPVYDQAALAAAAGCTYIPALRNGKPVEAPMTWQVVREPGSVRP
jgi:TonB family protein